MLGREEKLIDREGNCSKEEKTLLGRGGLSIRGTLYLWATILLMYSQVRISLFSHECINRTSRVTYLFKMTNTDTLLLICVYVVAY